jgi:hypothetical protein
LPPDESEDAGSSSALSGEMMNNVASYNIDNSRNEMPRIAELPQHRDIKKARRTREIDQLRSDVSKYLANKLAKKLNFDRVRAPWAKMKAGNIINWPADVKFKPVSKMNLTEVKILHELARENLLDYTPEFLGRFKFRPLNQSDRKRNELKSDVTKYLAQKLAKKLNVPSITIPWSQMKADDIINWPQDVKFNQIYKINIKELERLHKLANENQLDFTTEFLGRIKFGRVSNWTISRNQLRSDISTYLADKLAEKLNVARIKVPWSKMKAEDIINWPSDVKFEKPGQMNFYGLEKIHRLTSDDLLDFSPEFLRRRRIQLAEGKSTANEPETEGNFTMTN